MKRSTNIRQTLKKNLFTSPRPVIGSALYEKVRHHLFPNEELFISFLNEINLQNQIEKAKEILLLLAYRANFPPPTRLLYNILDLESSLSGKYQGQFISRDHFVHLVNLYLLGNYLFLYHHSINKTLISYFNRLRIENVVSDSDEDIAKKKILDFSFGWKMFVLYHDVAYPLEHWIGESEKHFDANREEIIRHLKAFNKIDKSLKKDLALKAFAKNIWAYEQIHHSKGQTLFATSRFDNVFNKKNLNEARADFSAWKDYELIEKVYTTDGLSTLRTIFGAEGILYVLTKSDTDVPLALIEFDNDLIECYLTKQGKTFRTLTACDCLEDFAIKLKSPKNLQAYWSVFIREPKQRYLKFFYKNFPGHKPKDFEPLVIEILRHVETEYNFITDKYSEFQHQFELYHYLFNNFFHDAEDNNWHELTQTDFLQEIYKPTVSSIRKDLAQIILAVIGKQIVPELTKVQDKDLNDLGAILEKLFQKLGSNPKEMAGSVLRNIDERIGETISAKLESHAVWVTLRESIKLSENDSKISIFPKDLADSKIKFSQIEFEYQGVLSGDLAQSLKMKLGSVSLGYLLNDGEYKPEFAKNKLAFCDHGIAAALITADVFNCYSKILDISNIKKSTESYDSTTQIIFGLQSVYDGATINHRLRFILPEVVMSIALHNIYPDDLKQAEGERYINSMDKSPFNFFCILSDSLQPWDRKRNHNPALRSTPYSTFGDKFDLRIEKDKIYIHEEGYGIDINERIKAFKQYLDGYLRGAKNMIKVSVSEF